MIDKLHRMPAGKNNNYIWQKQSMAPQCSTIDCAAYDPYKDFRRDPSGFYVLIRPDFSSLKIEAAICGKNHAIVRIFRGGKAQDIYEGIFQYEKKHGLAWFKDKGHIAYLGKELKKAE
ncbi:MAG: hypothetical protein HY591_05685, partial [Candidatus Omnitrophica bacterium]|nr:hypothetical protein [Candidatus Omnitrophota bacterium]